MSTDHLGNEITPLFLVVALCFISRASAEEAPATYAELVNIYMQLSPLNDQARASLSDSIQAVGTAHEGQGWMISANRGVFNYRERNSSKTSKMDISTELNMETFKREGDKFTFMVKVRSVYPQKGLVTSEYGQDDVVFSESSLEGAVKPMGIFQKELVLATGEKYAISVVMSPFYMPSAWEGSPSVK